MYLGFGKMKWYEIAKDMIGEERPTDIQKYLLKHYNMDVPIGTITSYISRKRKRERYENLK